MIEAKLSDLFDEVWKHRYKNRTDAHMYYVYKQVWMDGFLAGESKKHLTPTEKRRLRRES